MDEDNQVRTTIGAWLENLGYIVSNARSCEDALGLSAAEIFDVVVVDLQWPCLEGTQNLSLFRERMPSALLIAVSEFADRELEQEARSCGANFCLTKPLNLDEFKTILDSPVSFGQEPREGRFLPGKQVEQILLRGFSQDQQWDFRMIGNIRSYQSGETVLLNEDSSSMIWVEQGRLGVYLNGIQVESLGEGEYWGEESFVNPGIPLIRMVALENSQVRHFGRRKIIDFFAYHDETLTKRYMINLILCLQLKWKRHLAREARVNPVAAAGDV
jgi:CheY-like chemotaxis protein